MRRPAPALPPFLEKELPFDRYLVDVMGIRLHVMEAGDPKGQPVVMLHGNPTWSFLWRKVARALDGSGLRLVMPDLVGLGLSDKPPAWWHSLEAHGRTFASLLFDVLALGPIVFVGQDWGGPIGLWALAERPGNVRGLVLLNTVVGPPKPGFRPTTFHKFARMPVLSDIAFRVLGFPMSTLSRVQGDRASIHGDVARAYTWPLRHIAERAAPLALARMVPDGPEHPTLPALARCQTVVEGFRGPSALVWGERDPILGRVRSHIERLLPQAEVTRTQAGHFLQEEVPGPIAEAIRKVASAARAPAAA